MPDGIHGEEYKTREGSRRKSIILHGGNHPRLSSCQMLSRGSLLSIQILLGGLRIRGLPAHSDESSSIFTTMTALFQPHDVESDKCASR